MADVISPPRSRERLRSAEYEFDLAGGRLLRDGARVPIKPQPFQVLAALVERANDVVTRDELRRLVWGDETFVDFDAGLNTCIRQIRAALGETADRRFIETIPKRGYRFIPAVERIPPASPVAEPAGDAISPVLGPAGDMATGRPSPWFVAAVVACGMVTLLLVWWTAIDQPARASAGEARQLAEPARDAFLRAQYLLRHPTAESVARAIEPLTRVLADAPRYAEAHVALARAHRLQGQLGRGDLRSSYTQAAAAARAALQIDPRLGAAHFELAQGLWFGAWDWRGAGEAFDAAVRFAPDVAEHHHYRGYWLAAMGQHAASLDAVARAEALDPLSSVVVSDVGLFHLLAGDLTKAEAACLRTLDLEPRTVVSHVCLEQVYRTWKRDEDALSHLAAQLTLVGLSEADIAEVKALERGREPAARLRWWREHAADLERVPLARWGPYLRGRALTRLGDLEGALTWMARAIEVRDQWTALLPVDPALGPLRSAPGYAVLLERLHLAPAREASGSGLQASGARATPAFREAGSEPLKSLKPL